MAVKYECPKCGRRWLEWGAEKINFACPTCTSPGDIVKLLRLGSREEVELASAALRRRPKKELVVAAAVDEEIDDEVVDDEVEEDDDTVEEDADDTALVVVGDEDSDEDDAGDEEAPEDLEFGVDKGDFDESPSSEFDD